MTGENVMSIEHECFPSAQTMLQRQSAALDGQIDRLASALYGLTEDEIQIVEGAAA